MKLYGFDMDGTLIRGFIKTVRCETCKGEGRIASRVTEQAGVVITQYTPCLRCKAKGYLFGEHLPYDEVEVLPDVKKTLQELASEPETGFFIATNQGGIALGYQTVEQVERKLARVVQALDHFYGRPVTLHYSAHLPQAKPPWNDPDELRRRKPSGGMIVEAAAQHRADLADTVYVGDLATDREAAEHAGVRFTWAQDFFV